MATETSKALERPGAKWVMGVAQALCIAFIMWASQSITTSVTNFSAKLDGVVKSIADIAAVQVQQQRDTAALEQRVSKIEGKTESLEQRVTRMSFQVEQLEKVGGHGR